MLLLGLIFVLTALAAGLLLNLRSPEADPVEARLQELEARRRLMAAGAPAVPPAPPAGGGAGEGAPKEKGWKALLGAVDARLEARQFSRRLQERIRRAGLKLLPTEFLFFQVCAAALAITLSILLLGGAGWWLFGLLGFLLPYWYLGHREAARLKQFEGQLPDALGLIANSLRSGYSFLQAMDVVSREMPEPISKELAQVLRENKVGIPLEEALLGLGRRVNSPDLDLVITAVLIQRQVGGNLAEVVEKIALTIKERMRLLGQVRALTAQGRMSGWIVSLLPVALGLIFHFINPEYMQPLFAHPLGWGMLVAGAAMQVTGMAVIHKMVQMEV